jgi:hypothetical protein
LIVEDTVTLHPITDPHDVAVLPVFVTFIQGLRGKPEAVGWISIHLGTGLQQDTFRASDAFPPFDDLVSFLVRIALGPLPAGFELDEEGVVKEWCAGPVADPRLFRFSLTRDESFDGRRGTALIDGVFERRQFVREFYSKLSRFLATEHRPDLWRFEPLIPHGLMRLEEALEQMDAE